MTPMRNSHHRIVQNSRIILYGERKTEAPPTEGVNNQELMGKLTAPSAVASSAWFGDFICLNLQRILTTDLTDLTDKNAS